MLEKTNVLLATAEDHIFQEISASLSKNHQIIRVSEGANVLKTLISSSPVLIILDLQIGNMGGMATSLDLRLEQRAGRIPNQKILMLLDREADEFLGKRSEADCWIIKPIDPLSLSRQVAELLKS
ncbi:MAG: hypothetical protein CL430_05660 [Acidimicrobiaceae bacterium]|mgnify:CR=1 FL=1|jgi:DNA-binding response OmpR family regulator|nr:hypothetical protein [Acidimicrobiaceae bacterium]MDP6894149.1 hypothetical protein [Acidimicrobiales bacterium]|tara:strand:- start:1335 stop:1709 length:375 start_codon:yes stop_codon:yes gene_type:complete